MFARRLQIRVPHRRDGFIVARLGIALCATALFCTALTLPAAHAQSAPCGISKIITWNQAVYPPIAKAAHVSGAVVLMVQFDHDGNATEIKAISGPEMLRKAATDSAAAMKVNSFTGPRECPIVISFSIGDCDKRPPSPHSDLPTMYICAESPMINISRSDPTTKHHRFLLF